MHELFQLVPEARRHHAERAAAYVTETDTTWFQALLGRAGDALGPNLAVAVGAIAAHLPIEDIRLLTRYSAWLYLLDDRQDESGVTTRDLRRLATDIQLVLAQREPGGDD